MDGEWLEKFEGRLLGWGQPDHLGRFTIPFLWHESETLVPACHGPKTR